MYSHTYERDMTITRDRMLDVTGTYPTAYVSLEGNPDGNQFIHVWAVAGEALEVRETSAGEYVLIPGTLDIVDGFQPGPLGYEVDADVLPDVATTWLQSTLILLEITD
jgi:hypothetical protein